jgi:dihydrofolate reductase
MKKLSLIAAMSTNRVIGLNNRLPWRLSADLKRFKNLTMGHSLLMGRKTYESIGRPLPGRTIVVLTRQKDFAPPGVLVAHTLDQALKMAPGDEIFIAGGAEIYQQTLPLADRLYLTIVEGEFAGDAHFPPFDESDWRLLSEEHHEPTETSPYSHRFLVYERKTKD